MKYNLALDSGGTKVLAILYDEAFRPIRTCRVGSMRANSTPRQTILQNITALLDGLKLDGITLATVNGVCVKELQDALEQICTVENYILRSELQAGFASSGIKDDGYCAVAGTGSSLSCKWKQTVQFTGGYGSLIADEGSGYWIAREAFAAAIRDAEMRGEKTLLTDLIRDRFQSPANNFRHAAFAIYTDKTTSPVTAIAACAPLVTQAALKGDAIAYDILLRAGRSLGEQMASIPKCYGAPKDLPVTITGSVWKGHPIILSEFTRVLRENDMGQDFRIPEFEPIVGIILAHYYDTHDTLSPEEHTRFREMYSEYLYHLIQL